MLENNIVFGSVNANKRHWYKAAEALALADCAWLSRFIKRYECLEDFEKALDRTSGDTKVVIQMAEV